MLLLFDKDRVEAARITGLKWEVEVKAEAPLDLNASAILKVRRAVRPLELGGEVLLERVLARVDLHRLGADERLEL